MGLVIFQFITIDLNKVAGDTGLEPVNDGVKVRCLTDLANPQEF